MGVYNLGVNYVWISYNSFILPLQVQSIVPSDQKGLVLGAIVALSTTAGILVNILSGVLSDNIRLGRGKRWPYILIGTALTVISLLLPAILRLALFLVISSYFLVQIFTNLSAGSYQPLLPDLIEEKQRGESSGIQGLMTLIGSAIGFGLTGYLTGLGYFQYALVSLAAVFLFTTMITIRTIRAYDRSDALRKAMKLRDAISEIFRPRTVVSGFFWLVLGSFWIFMGSSGLTFFEIYYFETVLGISSPSSAAYAAGIAGIVILVVSMVSAVVLGSLSDKVGRRNMIIGAAVVAGLATFLIPFLRSFNNFLVVACLVGGPLGVFNSVGFALAGDLSPKEEAGKYMAYSNLSVGGASAVATLVDGLMLYIFGSTSVTAFIMLFSLSAAFYFLGAALLLRVPRR